jgi:hypothetical protein
MKSKVVVNREKLTSIDITISLTRSELCEIIANKQEHGISSAFDLACDQLMDACTNDSIVDQVSDEVASLKNKIMRDRLIGSTRGKLSSEDDIILPLPT